MEVKVTFFPFNWAVVRIKRESRWKCFRKCCLIPIYSIHSIFDNSSQREAINIAWIITLYKIIKKEFPPLKSNIGWVVNCWPTVVCRWIWSEQTFHFNVLVIKVKKLMFQYKFWISLLYWESGRFGSNGFSFMHSFNKYV